MNDDKDRVLGILNQVPEVVKLGLATPDSEAFADAMLDATRTYEVSVSNIFDATSPEDAVRQMAHWLADHGFNAGYRVEWYAEDGGTIGTFIDGESLDWDELGLE